MVMTQRVTKPSPTMKNPYTIKPWHENPRPQTTTNRKPKNGTGTPWKEDNPDHANK